MLQVVPGSGIQRAVSPTASCEGKTGVEMEALMAYRFSSDCLGYAQGSRWKGNDNRRDSCGEKTRRKSGDFQRRVHE